MRGPAPTPTAILEARGSPRAKLRLGEPRLPVERPSCPAWLKGEARAEWNRQAKALESAGILARCDRALLVAYCEAWGEFLQARQELEANGYTFTTDKGYVGPSPWVAIRNRAVERLVKLADRFGFSPAARARLHVVSDHGSEPDNGKLRFFRA
jgi:P27 family predicted phage terminase small subunit